jgi:hypothetical protein
MGLICVKKIPPPPTWSCLGPFKTFFKGAENAQVYDRTAPERKIAISFPVLQLLGHAIENSDWIPYRYSKLLFWSVSLLLFFGSLRLSEVFPQSVSAFDESTDLTWYDIIFRSDDSLSIHIKSPKTGGFPGQYVDLFRFSYKDRFCPVLFLGKLLTFQQENLSFPSKHPPFTFSSETFLTAPFFRQTVMSLLSPFKIFPKQSKPKFSFRSGIPSTLSMKQDANLQFVVQTWGRWTSSSFIVLS